MELQPGTLLRYTADPRDIWKVIRLTPKSAVMARCDAKGEFGPYGPSKWTFRITTVQRDFHSA